ncbi:hypothetical protein EWM64_g9418 [Hericium alpestre]|uniref:Aminoacyl-transfer RNA synthetases class-II family profile domain-containing protein n=1 Tax=Hericium alpestre TaxID=135208 RepID=A0A4Y9ZKZ5_9AGAM|nr:hypothetical protein EWM64_g9418 [Hericium alpestre]
MKSPPSLPCTIDPEHLFLQGPAGDIEIQVQSVTLLNPADRTLPFLPSDTQNLANEELRAQYRYLDLRRSELSANLRKRSQVANVVRTVLIERDFIEVETPILLKSTPEGAREFLVPTRVASSTSRDPGPRPEPLFYALPQSPQQPKQLLICSGGVDRYYQLARCFRDEDGRKDRQPEFTQIDLEMAFVSWGPPASADASNAWRIGGHEVRDVVEAMIRNVWAKVEGVALPEKFTVMTYAEAMSRFGSDKPDTRFGMEIADVKTHLPSDAVTALRSAGQTIECLAVRQSHDAQFIEAARRCPAEDGVECITITPENVTSWLARSETLALSPCAHAVSGGPSPNPPALAPGDIVYLSQRCDPPEGGSMRVTWVRGV